MNLTMDEILAALLRSPSADMTRAEQDAHRGRSFYAHVLFACRRAPSTEVSSIDFDVVHGRPFLLYSEEFLKRAGLHEAVLHLERAALGLILDHVPRALETVGLYPEDNREQAQRMAEVATYVTANEHLKNDPYYADAKYGTSPLLDAKDLRGLIHEAGYLLDIKDGQSVEYYVNRTMPASAGSGVLPGDGQPTHWSHKFPRRPNWADKNRLGAASPESIAHSFRAHAKALLARAREDVLRGRGTIPDGVKEWLERYLREEQVPWWKILAERVTAHQTSKGERSFAIYNRRKASLDVRCMPVGGRDVDPTFRIFLALDTSGSMDNSDMAVIFRELEAILAVNDEMTVRFIQADAEIHVDVVYKSGDRIEYTVVGRGGTDFDTAFRYMNQYCENPDTRPDLVILGTDGICPTVDPSARLPEDIPVIFLLTQPPSSQWWQAIVQDGYGEPIYVNPDHRATTV